MPSVVDPDDVAFNVTVRLPASVRRGTTVDVSVFMEGRPEIGTYDESAIDFSINGRGLWNPRVTPVGGEVSTAAFKGFGGTIFARGRHFGPRSRLGFTAQFDIAVDAAMEELHFQVHASVSDGRAKSKSLVRNYVATVD